MVKAQSFSESEIIYPDSDGKPMADNTKQFRWIVTIKENLECLFADNDHVFIAGDLLWYPVEGDNKTCQAPDAMVVFGRPKGDRGSYKQWLENQIAPQVVFEILSPGNTKAEMRRKWQFYQRFGVEEYYLFQGVTRRLKGLLDKAHSR
ncbi:Uma2 family endonuclease [Microcystis aeruginosa CS-555/01A07]|nr:Uma2 family endonuclease [Microcystis aeruginosa]MDB9430776.1 Uma2 family endonuclease [Microcystis aeruginosa CS-555/01A07]